MKIEFVGYTFCVDIPDCLPFYGKEKLCGIGGNYDGDCSDDLIFKNGTMLPGQKPPCKYWNYVNSWANDWITTDYFTPNPDNSKCVQGVDQDIPNKNCDIGKSTCKPIADSLTETGVFAKCNKLGTAAINLQFEDCVSDVCAVENYKCKALEAFANLCQKELNGFNIPFF
uniref:VWF/SSPO/Zonadhesin-like cysteine-rich domain-containing protein n=1 Tax=Panagrolaimus superbus TaxID=310955 RepID=A0A914YM43_9BILA